MINYLILVMVDFETTYDSVEWNYLEAIMVKMNFWSLWQRWTRECLSAMKTSILVNGFPTIEINLRKR